VRWSARQCAAVRAVGYTFGDTGSTLLGKSATSMPLGATPIAAGIGARRMPTLSTMVGTVRMVGRFHRGSTSCATGWGATIYYLQMETPLRGEDPEFAAYLRRLAGEWRS